jgi:ABC-type transport system involved in multi-copper enzyme maturation permease subunit
MGDRSSRAGTLGLLHYRPWHGPFHAPAAGVWPIARIALVMMFRRRLFWALFALGMLMFLLFFFGLYLLVWLETQTGETEVRAGLLGRLNVARTIRMLRSQAHLDGSAETYSSFVFYQGYMVMIVLALAGAVLVGNDLRFGSLPFYLSKPLSAWHYLLGKGLAVAVFINLMTTLPALVLFLHCGLYDPGDYYRSHAYLVPGILGYGAVVTVSLTLLLLATATWLQRTVPLVMTWAALFVFCRRLAFALVDRLHFNPHWELIDLWNDAYLVGRACLGHPSLGRQPAWYEAALVLGGVSLLCLIWLTRRIRGVEIVR